MPYRAFLSFPRRSRMNQFYSRVGAYRSVNRRYNAPARRIQTAARAMIRTRRYNMVRRNPLLMGNRFKRFGGKRKYNY